MSRSNEVVSFDGIIGRETDKAIQFTVISDEGESTVVWFPLSQVTQIHRTRSIVNETMDKIVVSAWIARQKELLYVE